MASEEIGIQQHFLGCSIRNFNLNIGWLNESTTLTVGLVEDDRLYERFESYIGELVRFQYDNFLFDGVLANIREIKSTSGNRVFEVDISDPRDLLDGVQLIIGGYTGYTYNVPNLYNVYGYLESLGFGRSLENEAGIPWKLVRDGFTTLNQTTPVYMGGYPYFVSVLGLPEVPNDFRISGTNVSLLDFIQQVCELANHDFTVLMVGNNIIITTFSRNIQQLNGSIYRFLRTLPQYVSTEAGFELQYNTANKFLVGSQVEQMYFQEYTPEVSGGIDTDSWTDTIARYWGKDQFGNVILSKKSLADDIVNYIKTDDDDDPNNQNKIPAQVNTLDKDFYTINESFYIDAKPISWPGNNFAKYHTDIDELRCVLQSKDVWETFLTTKMQRAIKFGKDDNIHWWKHNRFVKSPDMKVDKILDDFDPFVRGGNVNIHDLKPSDFAKLERNSEFSGNFDELAQKVYDYLYQYANEFLDKKFMVRVPFVFAKVDPDSSNSLEPNIITSLEPTETGYIEESLLDDAVRNNILPNYSDFLLSPENKIYCYVRYGPYNYTALDLSEIPEDEYIVDPPYIYIRATLEREQGLVFLNKTTAYSPRAVIELPGRVKLADENAIFNVIGQEYVTNKRLAAAQYYPVGSNEYLAEINRAKAEFQNWQKNVGAEFAFLDKSPYGIAPNMVAVPLKDNRTVYGPWYTQGMQGKVEFQQDFDLNPWNFGGFANMNAAGQAMVADAYTNTMIGETGSITVPGSPVFSVAHQLFVGGPIITGLDTSVGEEGITTNYRMKKWGRNFSALTRHRIDQFKKTHALRRESQKNFTKLFKPNKTSSIVKIGSAALQAKAQRKSRRKQSNSSHQLIMANSYPINTSGQNPSGEWGEVETTHSYNLASLPIYQSQNILDIDNWESVAAIGLEALFAPYSTESNSSMPSFEEVSNSSGINVNTLNPFQPEHNIGIGVIGAGTSGHQSINLSGQDDVYRGIGFKAPMVLAGWGYDVNGNPVPNGSGRPIPSGEPGYNDGSGEYSNDDFHPDYLTDSSLWPAGPIDIKWDKNRGVWVAGGSIPKYVRDLRVTQASGYTFFEYELVENGDANWLVYFASADCTDPSGGLP